MIVCSCNAIRERDIRDAARDGILDVEAIYAELGCAPNCCQCLPFAREIVNDEVCAPA